MVALCIFLSFRQRIQSYLIKKQCNYTWKRHNKYNHTCYHSQRIQLNFLIYHIFHRELRCLRHKIHMGLFLTFLLAGIAMLTSYLMFCLFFIFFCYCYNIADCNFWLICSHCRPLVDLYRTHSGEISFCCSNPNNLVIVLIFLVSIFKEVRQMDNEWMNEWMTTNKMPLRQQTKLNSGLFKLLLGQI